MAWSLAPSLDACRREANAIAPRRSKVSDGTIGDAAHAARTSDHNPGARDRVHALDLTHDPANGWDAHARLEQLRRNQDRRVKYLISEGKIAGPGTTVGGWHWQRYTGSNGHYHHGHISIWSTVAAETDTRPWWPEITYPQMPSAPAAFTRIESIEVDMVINVFTLALTTDAEGRGWDTVPFPRSRIVGHTGPGLRPGADGRYLVGQVGFAEEGDKTVVSVTEWAPSTTAVVHLSVMN